MPLYENKSCPVCHRPFQDGDDVVYCPECGTPHHRECFQQLNRCANEHLHGTGFSFFDEEQPEQTDSIVQEAKAMLPPEADQKTYKETENRQEGGFSPFGLPLFQPAYENDKDTIDGESVADVAAAVRTNAPRFITIFKKQETTGKKASWNWGAFFFSAYYFFYRKMYKQGILLLALNFALGYAESFFLAKLAPQTAKAIGEFTEQLASGSFNFDAMMSFSKTLAQLDDYHTFFWVQSGFVILSVVITLIMAIYADYIYKNTVIQLVRRTKARLAEDDELPLSVQTQDGGRLSDDQLKRLYLAQRGGTSYMVTALALFAWYLLNSLL